MKVDHLAQLKALSARLGKSMRPENHEQRASLEWAIARLTKKSKAAPRTSWLTPYWDAWCELYGDPPIGMTGPLTKSLRQLETKHGPTKTLLHFRNYLKVTTAAYVNLGKFSATFSQWAQPEIRRRDSGPTSRPQPALIATTPLTAEEREWKKRYQEKMAPR